MSAATAETITPIDRVLQRLTALGIPAQVVNATAVGITNQPDGARVWVNLLPLDTYQVTRGHDHYPTRTDLDEAIDDLLDACHK